MESAVTMMLARVIDSSRDYIMGCVCKLAWVLRGFKPSRKPVLWL